MTQKFLCILTGVVLNKTPNIGRKKFRIEHLNFFQSIFINFDIDETQEKSEFIQIF